MLNFNLPESWPDRYWVIIDTISTYHSSASCHFRQELAKQKLFRPNPMWQPPLVEQELLTLPEHLSSPPVFSGVRVTRSLVFCVVFCRSLCVCPVVLFLSVIGLSVLRFTDSVYPFGIFKLFILIKM